MPEDTPDSPTQSTALSGLKPGKKPTRDEEWVRCATCEKWVHGDEELAGICQGCRGGVKPGENPTREQSEQFCDEECKRAWDALCGVLLKNESITGRSSVLILRQEPNFVLRAALGIPLAEIAVTADEASDERVVGKFAPGTIEVRPVREETR